MKAENRSQNTVMVNVELSKELSIKLDRHLIDLKEEGTKVTKAQLLINCAELCMDESQ